MNEYVIIKRCTDELMWYSNHVGKIFKVLDYWSEIGYKVRQPSGFNNVILFKDAELITEGDKHE